MQTITKNLFVGKVSEILTLPQEYKIINLSHSFHYKMHEWKFGQKYQDEKCYLVHEDVHMMSVNFVDGPAALYDYQGQGVRTFHKLLLFIEKFIQAFPILIACDKATSRSPSLALLYLAKVSRVLPSTSYKDARVAFEERYPSYLPGGIAQFLEAKWDEL